MTHSPPIPATLDGWLAREAISFSPDAPESVHAAVDRMVASLGDSVELLGFGEALHGGGGIGGTRLFHIGPRWSCSNCKTTGHCPPAPQF